MGLKVGEAIPFKFHFQDSNGADITGETVTIDYWDELNNKSTDTATEVGNGVYYYSLTPDAAGCWILKATVSSGGNTYKKAWAFWVGKGQEADIYAKVDTEVAAIKTETDKIPTLLTESQSHPTLAEMEASNLDAAISTRATPAQVSAEVDEQTGNFAGQTNLQTLLAALAIPDIAGKGLYTCLVTDRLDHGTYGLSALDTDLGTLLARLSATRAGYLDELDFDLNARLGNPAGASLAADLLTIDNLVDDLETRLTAARGGYLDRLQYHSMTRTFPSLKDDVIDLTAAASDDNLPDVTLPNISGTIDEVYVAIFIRAIENTNAGGTNAINGAALKVRIKKSSGTWGVDDVVAIDLTDNQWGVAASTREMGDLIKGKNDVSSEVDAFNATYNLRFEDNQVDYDNLRLNDVQVFLIITYH